MINFFDVATDKEIDEMFGFVYEGEEKNNMRKMYEADHDTNYYFLTQLYVLRGNDEMAQESLEKIKDAKLRLDAGMSWQEFRP